MRSIRTIAGIAGAALGLALALPAQAQQISSGKIEDTARQRAAGGKVFVDTQHVEGTDFAGYRTYAWIPLDVTLQSPVLYQVPALKDWIRGGVESALADKGYSQVSYGEADFTLAYEVSVQDVAVLEKRRFRTARGYSRGRLPRWKEITEVTRTPEGTLILDVVDPDEDAVVWLGRVSGLIEGAVSERGVRDAITELLKQFPPP